MSVEEIAESEPVGAAAFGAFDEPELIAVGLVGPEGEPGQWRVRGMATAPERRGEGAGGAVLAALLEHAHGHGATQAWASVRTPARTLYERAGFCVDSEVYEPPHIGPHVIMRLELREDPRSSGRSPRPPAGRPREGA
jgi:GNAT superfamily N-acetyltransferase